MNYDLLSTLIMSGSENVTKVGTTDLNVLRLQSSKKIFRDTFQN